MNTASSLASTPHAYDRPYRPKPGQPNRLTKLQCPSCGSTAQMSGKSLDLSTGITCAKDGVAFAPAPRRVYLPRRNGVA